jgi:hypothetical protein
MICLPCREGGRLNADANRVYDEGSKKYLTLRALEAHGMCDGRCECHHFVGDFKNRRSDG